MIEKLQLTGNIGAEIRGLDLLEPMTGAEVDEVAKALSEHKVLAFRGLDRMGPKEHLAFAVQFGAPEIDEHPNHPDVDGVPGVKVIRHEGDLSRVDSWHTDGSTREFTPSYISTLRAVDIPPFGRDTVFANMEAVFDSLHPGMQSFLEGLTAMHSWGHQRPEAPPVEHPVVLVHPISGRKSLYVNKYYTRSIVGLPINQSEELLNFLFLQSHWAEFQLRVRWEPGMMVMWDNTNTQHYLVMDVVYPRVMHRVMTTSALKPA
jgi:alpha-ketoglutarate-dependent taurine dioxygenase